MSNILPKQISQWSVNDVCHWLKENRFEEQMDSFKEHSIDGKTLTLLDKTDIGELIKKIGPRVKFRTKLSQLLASKTIYKDNRDTGMIGRQHQQQQIRQSSDHVSQQRYNFIQVYQPPQQYIQQIPTQQVVRTGNQSTYGPPGYYQVPNGSSRQQNMYVKNNSQRNRFYTQQPSNGFTSRNANGHQNGYFVNSGQKRPTNNSSGEPVLKQFINEKGERKNYWSYNEPENGISSDDVLIKQETLSENEHSEEMNSMETHQVRTGNDVTTNETITSSEFDYDLTTSPHSKNSNAMNEEVNNNINKDNGKEISTTSNELKMPCDEKDVGITPSPGNKEQTIGSQNEENVESAINNEKEVLTNNDHLINDKTFDEVSMYQNDDFFDGYNESYDSKDEYDVNSEHSYGVEVIDVSKYETSGKSKQENKFASIETVTNRLALRERSKIFRKSEKKWHVAVNETAYQLVKNNPHLLQNKKELRLIAEAEVRKTYRFAKGKSRSIAIPENRIASEERKKQRLTKEKITDMKRKLNAEAEIVSRKMRQCHMNLTLSSQQSDKTKTMQLREEMQRLSQQQAKIHFSMDELLAKERKLINAGMNKSREFNGYANNDSNNVNFINETYSATYQQPTQAFINDSTFTYIQPAPANALPVQNVVQQASIMPAQQQIVAQVISPTIESESLENFNSYDENVTAAESSTM